MRNYITALGLLLGLGLSAQTHQIEKHNGESLDVNFIKYEDDILHYSSEGSDQEFQISKHAVAYLHDKNEASKEAVTNKITIDSKKDFGKVAVIDNEQAVGLNKQTDIEIYHGINKGGTSHFIKEDTIRRLKYKSAELGYPFITIIGKSNGKYSAVAYNY
ncbi:hypothetical protein [Flavobacterium frigidarium]|jgi:hypothetical protein|uniref:Uncharacterized protein n=1 Tax=Flavobacterium frigidarium TaxID=99286 RepID=A0ABV4KBE9_9FLAO